MRKWIKELRRSDTHQNKISNTKYNDGYYISAEVSAIEGPIEPST